MAGRDKRGFLNANTNNMALPLNIEDLITGQTVESERIEFKEGWNPEAILHSICAFANDINNWGGGYIVIGIKGNNGRPALPPIGLNPNQIDAYQKKLIELCHKLTPYYFPVPSPVVFQKKHILVLWVPGRDTRPYKAPKTLAKKKSEQLYYVRRGSSTVKANHTEESQLLRLASKVPFDDRINHNASISDFNPHLIKSFLSRIGSDLHYLMDSMSLEELCAQMQIARGPKEYFKPVNVGLLLFTNNPEKYFPYTRIEVVEYLDDIGDKFTEKPFAGPIHIQLEDALRFIKNTIIKEEVRKIPDEARALRFFNFPYSAVEETLANAVYHKSYIDNKMLKKPVVAASTYRNRRIGDFLKELDLTEGRSTGFPKIRRTMKFNGSPKPIFETNKNRDYFLAILPIHPKARKKAQVELTKTQISILRFCADNVASKLQIAKHLGQSGPSGSLKKAMTSLVNAGLLELTIPEKPQSSKQRYKTTEKGSKTIEEKAGLRIRNISS